MNMSLYFAEYREGIGTGEAVIALPECPKKSRFTVKIEDDKLFCCNEDKSVFLRGNLPFKFRQNEQQKPRVSLSESRFVYVRFPRQSITQLETAPTTTSEKLSSEDFIFWSANRTNLPYSLKCSFCGHKLSRDNSMVDKVFPLPSEDFKDMAGDIFCHGHSTHIDRVISGEIVPKRDEFFLNESFVMMCSDTLHPGHVLARNANSGHIARTGIVNCSRCMSTLGKWRTQRESSNSQNTAERQNQIFSLEWGKIVLQTKGFPAVGEIANGPLSSKLYLATTVVNKLVSLVKQFGNFRFLLKDTLFQVYACLWHINSNVVLSTNVDTSPMFVNSPSNVLNRDPNTVLPTPFKAMKIMFKNCLKEENESMMNSWMKDGTVESLVFEEDECMEILMALEESCRTLPPTMREASAFSVGYLRLY